MFKSGNFFTFLYILGLIFVSYKAWSGSKGPRSQKKEPKGGNNRTSPATGRSRVNKSKSPNHWTSQLQDLSKKLSSLQSLDQLNGQNKTAKSLRQIAHEVRLELNQHLHRSDPVRLAETTQRVKKRNAGKQGVADMPNQEPETKESLSHTQVMRDKFSSLVALLQGTDLNNRALSLFERDLLAQVAALSPAEVQVMRRSQMLIYRDKLQRLYLDNVDLPERVMTKLGAYLKAIQDIQEEEEEVQHMAIKSPVRVEGVQSAKALKAAGERSKKLSHYQQAIILKEILDKPKGMRAGR